MSSVITGCRAWLSDPCSRMATWPQMLLSMLQRLGVGDARQDDPRAGAVQDGPGAVLAPALAQLRLTVHHGDDLDALAAAVGQPLRQRYRAYLA